jgi:hypothetical protein
MEAEGSFETLVTTYKTSQYYSTKEHRINVKDMTIIPVIHCCA